LLLLWFLDALSAPDATNAGVASSASTDNSSVKTVDKSHKPTIAGQRVPSTLLSRSTTEFELHCETDTVFETPVKRIKSADKTATAASSATDLMSGGILVASSSLSNTDVADNNSMLNTSSESTMKVCSEDILPHLKHKQNYNTKVSHSTAAHAGHGRFHFLLISCKGT